MKAPKTQTTSKLGLLLLLGGILVAPLLLARTDFAKNRRQFYSAMPTELGPFDYIRSQIFDEKEPLEVAFVGASLMRDSIDVSAMREELGLSNESSVALLGFPWAGEDMVYVVLRDLLAHRKVKILVLTTPTPRHTSNKMHPNLFRLVGVDDLLSFSQGLNFSQRLSAYAAGVLGAPRQILSALRSDIGGRDLALDKTSGLKPREMGYQGAPFHRRTFSPPRIAGSALLYSQEGKSSFRFEGEPPNLYQRTFLRRIGELVKQYGVPTLIVHIPRSSERHFTDVVERAYWPEIMEAPVDLAGIAPSRLFAGMSEADIDDCFYDEHMNINGKELFSRAIAPAIRAFRENNYRGLAWTKPN